MAYCPVCHQPMTSPLYQTQINPFAPFANNAAAPMPANVYYPNYNCNAMAPLAGGGVYAANGCAGGVPSMYYNVVL